MAITIPTVDEFTESTVMLVIREIAEYICGDNGLVAQINNNDINGFTSSYTNNVLKIDATKGDGSTLPVCNVTIEGGGSSTGNPYPTGVSGIVGSDGNITFTITMSSGSPLTTTINMNYFASTSDLSDLQEQVTGIKPTVTVNTDVSPPTISIAVNGTTSTASLPSSGGSTIEIIEENELDLQTLCSKLYNLNIGDTFTLLKIKLKDNTTMYINGTFCGSADGISAIKYGCVSGLYQKYTISNITIYTDKLIFNYRAPDDNVDSGITITNDNYLDCERLIINRYS